MSDDIPQWAKERACELANEQIGRDYWEGGDVLNRGMGISGDAMIAFARYIAAHEEAPVDPLLIEAREIAAGFNGLIGDKVRSGGMDMTDHVCIALAALKRGMELAK